MKFLGFEITRAEKRSLENPATPITDSSLAEVGAIATASGLSITPNTSMRVSAVYACVRVISETLASLPLQVFERTDQGKRLATERAEYRILHDAPSPIMTSFTWRESTQANLLLNGNGYAEIEWANNGQLRGLWPIQPSRVNTIVRKDGSKVHEVLTDKGTVTIPDEDMLHVPGLGFDGIRGFNPIAMMRQSIGLSMATEEYGSRMFKNGLRPSGVLRHPKGLSDPAIARLSKQMNDGFSGLANAHRLLVLEDGMEYTQTSLNPDDAQFLETRKFQVSEIARIFRVPPHLIGDLEKATFSNIEQQSLEFVIHTIRPWLVRWEQELNRKLFMRNSPYFASFNVDGLLRGDIKSRYEAYAIGRNWGWLSANDVREKENMNAIDNGDVYNTPLNMGEAGKPQPQNPTSSNT